MYQAPGEFTLTFTSLSIIILSIFVLLTSLASPDVAKQNEVRESIEAQFGIEVERLDLTVTVPETISRLKGKSLVEDFTTLSALATKHGFSGNQELEAFVLEVPTASLFILGGSEVRAAALPFFRELAAEMQRENLRLEIEVKEQMTPEDGLRIPAIRSSVKRAASLVRLFQDLEVETSNITASGRVEETNLAAIYFTFMGENAS